MANEGLISKYKLKADSTQPRRYISRDKIEKKIAQLRADGQVSPILIWPPKEDGSAELVDGETRWQAAMEMDDSELLELRYEVYGGSREDRAKLLLTQLLRNDDGSEPLTAMERAVAYKQLVEQHQDDDEKGSAVKQVADKLGLDYSSFTRALKVAEMSEDVSQFVLQHGIDDKRVINGIMRVEQRATRDRFQELLEDIRDNEVKKEKRNGGETTTTTRAIVSEAVKELKDPKARRTAKEKTKRRLDARQISFKFREGGEDTMVIETPREIITFKISPEMVAKFRGIELEEVESGTSTYTV